MSTLVFGSITPPQAPPPAGKKVAGGSAEAAKEPSATTQITSWAQAVAALVPAEILLVHAALLQVTTETTQATDDAAVAVTTITAPQTLFWSFWGFALVSFALYVGFHYYNLWKEGKKWDNLDYLRMFIPPLAFIDWTILQKSTAFDAVAPGLPVAPRVAIGLFLAIILVAGAALLRYKVPESPADDAAASQGGEGNQDPSAQPPPGA